MKKFILLLSCIVFISCFKEPKKANKEEIPTYAVDTSSNNNNSINRENLKVKKFAYVVVNSEISKIYNGETYKFSSKVEYTKEERTVYFCSLSYKDTVFVSEVIEIEDNNEEQQNALLNYENKVKQKLAETDKWLIEIKLKACKNTEDLDKIRASRLESKIIDKQIFVFDSYSEASIDKNNKK
jgi:hypothetical protein